MTPLRLSDETRYIGPPKDWTEENGECSFLSVADIVGENGLPYMVSAWLPNDDEVQALIKGHPIYLWINGTPETQHPVVALAV